MIEITISSDPAALGPDATPGDVERYAAQLAAEMAEEFGCDTRSRVSGYTTVVGATDGEYDLAASVAERVSEIESGDEWIHVLERATA